MVDFQSRDTRRGFSFDDDDEEDEEDEAETVADADETGTGQKTETDENGDETDAERSETADATDATESDEPSATEATGTDEDASAADTERTLETTSATESAHSDDRVNEQDDGVTPTADPVRKPNESTADDTAATTGTADPPATQSRDPPAVTAVDAALVTVGTTTDRGEDPTGEALAAAIEAAGYGVTVRERLHQDYDGIQQAVNTLVGRDDVDIVVTAGGVGVTTDDVTIEAVHPLFEKSLPGFGEVFRSFLFDEIGTGIVSVRATAGIADGTPVFCLPADEGAAGVAIDEIITAEAPDLLDNIEG
ncbi:molybdopterin-binding protein [Haloarcula amylovorans]|uniref:molybdopterin-binding protein n=1 Tax=Haloarcula amylovorans TaxID=2562280 RepID=UPI001075D317|nr:molybdopterin-binding protein [Halomicroarcula amylolytica]